MKAELKRLHSPDIPDLQNYSPEEQTNFGFLLQAMIGPRDQDGEESFDMIVCTPQWLMLNKQKEDVVFGNHYVFVFEYNYSRLIKALTSRVNSLDGEDWDQLTAQLRWIGKWEFEDYQE